MHIFLAIVENRERRYHKFGLKEECKLYYRQMRLVSFIDEMWRIVAKLFYIARNQIFVFPKDICILQACYSLSH